MHWRSSQIQKVAPEPKEPRLSSPRPRGTLKTKHESWKDTKSKHTLGKSICNNVNENLKVQYYTCLHVIRVTFLPLCLPLCGILVCINQSWLFQFHPHSLKTGKQRAEYLLHPYPRRCCGTPQIASWTLWHWSSWRGQHEGNTAEREERQTEDKWVPHEFQYNVLGAVVMQPKVFKVTHKLQSQDTDMRISKVLCCSSNNWDNWVF